MLDSLHKRLLAKSEIDPLWLRRNHAGYELVSYASNLVALYLAENYEAMPLFVSRSYQFLTGKRAEHVSREYRDLMLRYLIVLSEFLLARSDLDNTQRSFIPVELSHAQPVVYGLLPQEAGEVEADRGR